MLNEKEDDAGKKLGDSSTNGESETSERRPELRRARSESFTEECRVDETDGDEDDEAENLVEDADSTKRVSV